MHHQAAELENYIRQQQQAGYDTNQIRAELIANNWDAQLVDNALGAEPEYSDRINRRGYIQAELCVLSLLVIPSLLLWLTGLLNVTGVVEVISKVISIVCAVLFLLLLIPVIFFTSRRRLPDVGREWYWLLLFGLPVIGMALWIYLHVAPGQQANKFGSPNTDYRLLTALGFKNPKLN